MPKIHDERQFFDRDEAAKPRPVKHIYQRKPRVRADWHTQFQRPLEPSLNKRVAQEQAKSEARIAYYRSMLVPPMTTEDAVDFFLTEEKRVDRDDP